MKGTRHIPETRCWGITCVIFMMLFTGSCKFPHSLNPEAREKNAQTIANTLFMEVWTHIITAKGYKKWHINTDINTLGFIYMSDLVVVIFTFIFLAKQHQKKSNNIFTHNHARMPHVFEFDCHCYFLQLVTRISIKDCSHVVRKAVSPQYLRWRLCIAFCQIYQPTLCFNKLHLRMQKKNCERPVRHDEERRMSQICCGANF